MSYPIVYQADYPEKRNRLTVFFRLLIAIPWLIVSAIYGIGVFFAVIIAWFALLFTARYPQGLYDFNAGYLRLAARVNGFTYLQVDELPPFDSGEHPEYPVRALISPAQESYSRVLVLLRIFLFIPVYIVLYALQIVGQIVGLIVWVVGVIAGSTPKGLQDTLKFCLMYQTKALAYGLLLTDRFPDFSDDSDVAPPSYVGPSSGAPLAPPTGAPVSSPPPPPPGA